MIKYFLLYNLYIHLKHETDFIFNGVNFIRILKTTHDLQATITTYLLKITLNIFQFKY